MLSAALPCWSPLRSSAAIPASSGLAVHFGVSGVLPIEPNIFVLCTHGKGTLFSVCNINKDT